MLRTYQYLLGKVSTFWWCRSTATISYQYLLGKVSTGDAKKALIEFIVSISIR